MRGAKLERKEKTMLQVRAKLEINLKQREMGAKAMDASRRIVKGREKRRKQHGSMRSRKCFNLSMLI